MFKIIQIAAAPHPAILILGLAIPLCYPWLTAMTRSWLIGQVNDFPFPVVLFKD
jgi:hypothetical protein